MKEKLLKEVIDKVCQASDGWRDWLQGAEVDPQEMDEEEDLDQIPVMRREQLLNQQKMRPPLGRLETIPVTEFTKIYSTTWGGYIPQRDQRDFGNFAEALSAAGFYKQDIVWNALPESSKLLSSMIDSGLQSLGCTVISSDLFNPSNLLQNIQEWGVTAFIGSPQTLAMLLEAAGISHLNQGRIFQLEKAFLLGGMVPPMLLKKIEYCDIRLAEGFALEETGCIAYRTNKEVEWKVNEQAIVHICDPVSGAPIYNNELGEIVVTLLNPWYPLIRYGTGNLAIWMEGRQGEKFTRIFGHVDEIVVVGSRIIHLLQIEKMIKGFAEIEYFQGNILKEPGGGDHLLLRLESAIQTLPFKEMISQRLKEELRVPLKFEFVPVHSLDRKQRQLIDQRK